MLKELVELTVLDEGDPQSFRVRAYESACQAIEAFGGDLGKLSASELTKIPGVGKSTAGKIRELLEHGKVEKLEGLRQKHPPEVVALMRLPGVGPKAVARLRKELGVQSLEDLKKALDEHKLRGLKGFGEKSELKMKEALARLSADGEKRTPISVALPVAQRIVAELLEVPGVVHAEFCGSLRRFSETVGDVDVVVAAREAAPVMERVHKLRLNDREIASGATKTSFLTRRGLQVDVRVVEPAQIGAALMYFTGSKAHNIRLRQRALDRGYTLNEYALSKLDGGAVVARETEEQIYAALGLPWIPPVLRDLGSEIDMAERGELPAPVEPSLIKGDFHVHTSLSGDAHAPLESVIAAARARGYTMLAITEHAENLAVAGVGREALTAQRARIKQLQTELGDSFLLLHGIELNIGPEGELDYDAGFRAEFDWCLASVHDHFGLDKDAQTKRVLAAMRDPSVSMIGHLTARLIGGRPAIPLDLDAVFAEAERTRTALEVNGGLPRLDLSVDLLRLARSRQVTFVLTSDAHDVDELDRVEHACKNAHKAGIPLERIANTWSPERVRAWVHDKRSARLG